MEDGCTMDCVGFVFDMTQAQDAGGLSAYPRNNSNFIFNSLCDDIIFKCTNFKREI